MNNREFPASLSAPWSPRFPCPMSSLAELPKLIGFFSYSRDDDEGDDGALSALSDRIYLELRSQLGRTKEDFQLWRDKDALAVGEHWKSGLKEAVSESVFFITIVTPSALNSPYCRFEFESFIERERVLGRDDLIFPILYINVPELEDDRTEADPVVSIIAARQYANWRRIRHRDVNTAEVKQVVEEFCTPIARKLRQQWISPEERKQRDEVEARKQAERERAILEAAETPRAQETREKEAREQEERTQREAALAAQARRVQEERQQEVPRPESLIEASERREKVPRPDERHARTEVTALGASPEPDKFKTDARIVIGLFIGLIAFIAIAFVIPAIMLFTARG